MMMNTPALMKRASVVQEANPVRPKAIHHLFPAFMESLYRMSTGFMKVALMVLIFYCFFDEGENEGEKLRSCYRGPQQDTGGAGTGGDDDDDEMMMMMMVINDGGSAPGVRGKKLKLGGADRVLVRGAGEEEGLAGGAERVQDRRGQKARQAQVTLRHLWYRGVL